MSNTAKSNNPAVEEEEEDDEEDVFLGESDVIHEFDVDAEGFFYFSLLKVVTFKLYVTRVLWIQIFLKQMMMMTMKKKSLVVTLHHTSCIFPCVPLSLRLFCCCT